MDRDLIIMANARRLIKRTRMPNHVLYAELFGTGSTTAFKRCIDLGLDPDSNSVHKRKEDQINNKQKD